MCHLQTFLSIKHLDIRAKTKHDCIVSTDESEQTTLKSQCWWDLLGPQLLNLFSAHINKQEHHTRIHCIERTHNAIPIKQSTDRQQTCTDVKQTGSLRILWGIKNMCLVFAMSTTRKAGDAAAMQKMMCKYVFWGTQLKDAAFLPVLCFVFLQHLQTHTVISFFLFQGEEKSPHFAYIWTFYLPFLLALISLSLVEREKRRERDRWRETRGRDR